MSAPERVAPDPFADVFGAGRGLPPDPPSVYCYAQTPEFGVCATQYHLIDGLTYLVRPDGTRAQYPTLYCVMCGAALEGSAP